MDEQSRDEPDIGLVVHHDDSVFQELSADLDQFHENDRLQWNQAHLKRFKEDRRFHFGVARAFVALSSDQKKEMLAWLETNPLSSSPDVEERTLLARAALGDENALDELMDVLRRCDQDRCQLALGAAGTIDWSEFPRLFERRDELLLPLLDHPDRKVVGSLRGILERQEESFWWEAVRQRMIDASYPYKDTLSFLLAKASDPGAIALVRRAFVERPADDNGRSFLFSLRTMAQREDPGWHEAAAEALFDLAESDPIATADIHSLLFELDPERTLPLTEQYLFEVMQLEPLEDTHPAWWLLGLWARHNRGPEVDETLRAWTQHESLGTYAFDALVERHAGSEDDALAEEVYRRAIDSGDRFRSHAVASIGGERSKDLALELFLRSGASPEYAVGMRWVSMGITLDEACELSVEHGLLPRMPTDETLTKARALHDPLGSRFGHWLNVLVLEGRAASFDTETSTFPNRHDELIMNELRDGGGGLFRPTRAIEVWREGEYYDIAFEHDSKWYQFRAESHGDWYDVASVLRAANRALEDAGAVERFHSIPTGGQNAVLVVATPESFVNVSRELSLPVDGDPDRARELGKAFEDSLRRRLGIDETSR